MKKVMLLMALTLSSPIAAAVADDTSMASIVEWLTQPKWEGRANRSDVLGPLSQELTERLTGYGGEVGQQEFAIQGGDILHNVVWRRAGSDPNAGWVVLGAHYDHLGRGEQGGPHAGEIYPGADDNASGVAVALGVVQRLQDYERPERGICVAFFAGEEIGLQGSKAFLEAGPLAEDSIVAMINLDTVGRLAEGGLSVFGVESASEFSSILDGLDSAHGLKPMKIGRSSGASDDATFAKAAIPTLHLFTGANADYHRPSDTADKVDIEGLDRIADFTADLIDYCAASSTRLDFVPQGADAARPDPARATAGRRRVSFGSIPDFQFPGPGVRITGVLPDSPAAKAGLQDGDVIVRFGGEEVMDLTDYSEAMKLRSPGDVVEVDFERGGEHRTVSVTLVERK